MYSYFSSSEDGSVDSEEELSNLTLTLLRIRENNPYARKLKGSGGDRRVQNMTDEDWEDLGRDLSIDIYLTELDLNSGALNDHKTSIFFRGLTRSDTIRVMELYRNGISVAGVRSMVPFLQNASNLIDLNLNENNNLQSEGFNTLLRSLRDSPIKVLCCSGCGIESIEIDNEQKPKHLERLFLANNSIDADGCRGLAKLLQGGDAILTELSLPGNKIDDQGVDILVDALRKNKSLTRLSLGENDGISKQGQIMLLKLVNDISSINATLQSNHTVRFFRVNSVNDPNDVKKQIQRHINLAVRINTQKRKIPDAAGRMKIIDIQLNSDRRAELAELQGVNHSLYSGINPLHLPELLALVYWYHGQGELYAALKSSIAGVISTVNRKQCLQQQMAYHRARIDAIKAEIATIEAMEKAEGSHIGSECRSSKRRRA